MGIGYIMKWKEGTMTTLNDLYRIRVFSEQFTRRTRTEVFTCFDKVFVIELLLMNYFIIMLFGAIT